MQSDVEKIDSDLLKLGLLHGDMSPKKASLQKQPNLLTLPHKMFQDYLGGYFLLRKTKVLFFSLEIASRFKSECRKFRMSPKG